MAEKKQIEIEFMIRSSVKILYQCLSTSSGLSEWFADDVTIKRDEAKFVWEGNTEEATILAKKQDQFIRYQMLELEGTDYYFEFLIKTDPLTGDVALLITDFVDEDEEEEQRLLWESQIGELKHILGS
ncbi:MAG: SRPBCC domain-containing protein [Flavobacteriales bacterium]|nr:SRPBCC domain-containing protein [Flavobacteriales bacterium]NCG29761.1 SRPBCC domain-containing protein [Bacteroidota bacterium]MBT3964791.1 SRPBCC domain-containing protein [Flavobacteriales bacterium]MBT4704089.1 SRPBCC domain-containing protein [Flavobacteriales bacterium]MBT4930736.1 SRPBCC domain-containing protein [Flavobacteriales bacterium]